MGKDKLRRFAEITTFENVIELEDGKILKGNWAEQHFKNKYPVILELGCGKGEYTVNLARLFPEINFIAHTHPPHTTKILCSNQLYQFANHRWFPDQIVRNGTKSCVVPYAPPGEAILRLVEKHVTKFIEHEGFFPKLILLQNHGIITASASKKDCAAATLMCEKSADIFVGAKLLGGVKFLTKQEVADVDTCPNENYRRNMYQ